MADDTRKPEGRPLTPGPSPASPQTVSGRGEDDEAAVLAQETRAKDERLARLQDRFGERLRRLVEAEHEFDFLVAPEALVELVLALREEILSGPHSFCDVCGVERPEGFECVYRFSALGEPLRVTVRVRAPRNEPVLPTLTGLYRGALWPEREFAEMFGVRMEGHPDPRHLLLPEDWDGHPLRKDYVYPLDHPWVAPDPLRDDPGAVLCPPASDDEPDATDR